MIAGFPAPLTEQARQKTEQDKSDVRGDSNRGWQNHGRLWEMGLEGFTNVSGTHQGGVVLPWWSDGGTNPCPRQPIPLSCRYW